MGGMVPRVDPARVDPRLVPGIIPQAEWHDKCNKLNTRMAVVCTRIGLVIISMLLFGTAFDTVGGQKLYEVFGDDEGCR